MGFKDTEWAYSLALKPMQSAVLAAICHRTDDATHRTVVGQQTIADMIGCDRVTVLRSLGALELSGILRRTARNRKDGSKTSDTITVLTESYVAQSNVAPSHVAESRPTSDSLQQQEETSSSTVNQRSTRGAAKRGTRINDDFTVTPEMVAWAREHAPLVDGKVATQMFINYYQAKTGRDATKLDWARTWQNWMLRDQQTEARRPRPKRTPDERAMDTRGLDMQLATDITDPLEIAS